MATTQINDYSTNTAMLDGSMAYAQGIGNEATQKLLNDELKKAGLSKKYRDMMQFIGSKDYKAMNIVDRMTIIVEMIVNDLDKNIEKLVQQLYDKSQQLKNVTKSRAENNPGLISGMGTETGILQAILTMKVQERQRILEFLTNFARTVHETEKRAIDRIVA